MIFPYFHIIAFFYDFNFTQIDKNRMVLKNVRKFVRVYFPQTAVFDTKAVQDLRALLK
jgi:hypothetical protein